MQKANSSAFQTSAR